MDLLGALRLCANVPGQFAIEAALHGADTITELCQPGGRLYEARRAVVESCAASEHLKLVAPAGALYASPGITGAAAESFDDHAFALELLETQVVLVGRRAMICRAACRGCGCQYVWIPEVGGGLTKKKK